MSMECKPLLSSLSVFFQLRSASNSVGVCQTTTGLIAGELGHRLLLVDSSPATIDGPTALPSKREKVANASMAPSGLQLR